MNHDTLGICIVLLGVLGVVELLAWHFKLRWWIFTRNEHRIAQEDGEDIVFRRRLVAAVTALVVGCVTIFLGNF